MKTVTRNELRVMSKINIQYASRITHHALRIMEIEWNL